MAATTPGAPNAFQRVVGAFDALMRVLVGIAFAVLLVTVLIQVSGRSFFASSPVWTEELTRFALLFMVAFGVGVSLRNGDLVNVDVIVEALPPRPAFALRLLCALLTVALCAILIWPAWRFTAIGALQTSPALGLRMTFVHASVLILIAALGFFALVRAVGMIAGWDDGRAISDREELS